MNSSIVTKEQRELRIKRILAYFALYLLVFVLLENRTITPYLLNSSLDAKIPFCPVFVIPYFLWFVYIPLSVAGITLFCGDKQYEPFVRSLILGNTLFLVISFLFPNGHTLRPVLEGGGLCTQLVGFLYRIDSSTNILPSMHVFTSVVCCIALCKTGLFQKHPAAGHAVRLLTVLIVLSTVLIKQHTLLDVVASLALNFFCYALFCEGQVLVTPNRKQKHRIFWYDE